jgi:hypothetical protein
MVTPVKLKHNSFPGFRRDSGKLKREIIVRGSHINLQNHYFARQADMDEENTIETVDPDNEENMEEADTPREHAWRRDHALLHDLDDESHQDEEAYTRNRDKFSGLL